jgi:outer membrane protein assembly factor BamB
MSRSTVCVNLLASLALIMGAQAVCSQVTSDWPGDNATPQQTRFANVTFGGPPSRILWAYTNPGAFYHVISDGLLVLTCGIVPALTTIHDAETGECLYTFPETKLPSALALGKIGTQTTLFRSVPVVDNIQQITVVTLTAYDLGPILARTPGAEPLPTWSAEFTLHGGRLWPSLNYMEGVVYLYNGGGIIKIDGTTGDSLWANDVPAEANLAVGDVWVPDAAGPRLERLVIAPGSPDNTVKALYDRDGSVAWQTTAERAQYVTLVKVPSPTGPLDAWRVVIPFETSSLLCLNASDGSIMPNWPRPLKADCYAANGPVAVRYLYDASGNVTDATIFITPGSDGPSDSVHPLFAFDLNGGNAWPAPLPNPIQLPAAAGWTEPAVTQDRVFLILQDGSLFSVDLKSGTTSVNQFDLNWQFELPMVADNGHGPLIYATSISLGYLALAPTDRFPSGAPRLTISLTATNTMLISWPSPCSGFALQQNSNLSTTNWVTLTNTPVTVGSQNQVTMPSPTGNQFYRLMQP